MWYHINRRINSKESGMGSDANSNCMSNNTKPYRISLAIGKCLAIHSTLRYSYISLICRINVLWGICRYLKCSTIMLEYIYMTAFEANCHAEWSQLKVDRDISILMANEKNLIKMKPVAFYILSL